MDCPQGCGIHVDLPLDRRTVRNELDESSVVIGWYLPYAECLDNGSDWVLMVPLHSKLPLPDTHCRVKVSYVEVPSLPVNIRRHVESIKIGSHHPGESIQVGSDLVVRKTHVHDVLD